MINTKDILKLEFLSDKSSILKYQLSHGETSSEVVYLERTLNAKETQRLVSRLSEMINNYKE